ncbi:hypothetical protein LCGC14_0922560 [marine sediment metagenome]|uniref:Uncharacterized protein n=1 Tax=marine sediment metagenome TaxID=412755 RepID=A0A0F9R928_9ZZZZ
MSIEHKVGRGQARRIAEKCEFIDDGCPICYYSGSNEPMVCCAYCVKLTICGEDELCEFISGKMEEGR